MANQVAESTHEVSQLLVHWQQGDQTALDSLVPLVDGELRKIARRHLSKQANHASLESRVLVLELYLKMPQLKNVHWEGPDHFLCAMSHLMRQVLIDHAPAGTPRSGRALRFHSMRAWVLLNRLT